MSTLPHDFLRRDLVRVFNSNLDILDTHAADITAVQGDVTTLEGQMGATGTATMPADNTLVTVTHNRGNTNYKVTVLPNADLGTGRRYWVANKQQNSFDIMLDAAVSPSGSRTFDWILRGT